MEKRITFSFENPPFDDSFKIFSRFLTKYEVIKGIDGLYHISKTKKNYLNFLKKLHIIMKENDLLKNYKKVYGMVLKDSINKGTIIFEKLKEPKEVKNVTK